MKITDLLRGEHGVFYAQFDYLERAAPVAGTLTEVQTQAAVLAAGLASHAHLEDELLFAALDPYFGGAGPLAVMRFDHEEIEGAFDRLPKAEDLAPAQELLLSTVATARQHFAKEEQVLFSMAEQMLDEAALVKLGRKWLDRRGVTVV